MEFTSLIKRERVKNTFEQINNAVRAKMEDGGISCVLKLTSVPLYRKRAHTACSFSLPGLCFVQETNVATHFQFVSL